MCVCVSVAILCSGIEQLGKNPQTHRLKYSLLGSLRERFLTPAPMSFWKGPKARSSAKVHTEETL